MPGIVYNFFLFSALIVIQTFILNNYGFYDLLLVWIVFMFTHENVKSRVFFLCILAGYFKDALSGGVFGVYISSYVWFYLLIYITSGFFNINNYAFILLFGFCGILIETFFIFMSNYIWLVSRPLLDEFYNYLMFEFIWCLVTFLIFYFVLIFFKLWMLSLRSEIGKKINRLSRI